MAIEAKRGCGYRTMHKLYLVGEYSFVPCDRLPLPIGHCPYCGSGIRFSRNMAQINPLKLWGIHNDCKDEHHPCHVCDPTNEPAFIMGVGQEYTPQEFILEAVKQGISKKIPALPKNFKLGETILYLAHNKSCISPSTEESNVIKEAEDILQKKLIESQQEYHLGIFCAFIPQRIEMLFYESEITERLKKRMEKRGITIVPVKDGDPDHKMPRKPKRKRR